MVCGLGSHQRSARRAPARDPLDHRNADGSVLLANVHVGGIPRSTDGGVTWQPTIDVDSDVHEVRAHPHRSGVVMAAAAIGLCASRDGGRHGTSNRRACTPRIAPRSRLRATTSCVRISRPLRSAGRNLPTTGGWRRFAGRRRRRPARMDRRHRRHRLHRYARLRSCGC